MSSDARDATNAGSSPWLRMASAVTGPTAAILGPVSPASPWLTAATPFTLVSTIQS
jgi:hypothetical protein